MHYAEKQIDYRATCDELLKLSSEKKNEGLNNPVESIKFKMERQELTQKYPEQFIGSSGRVSEVPNNKRRLSLAMLKRLHDGLYIPYESLLSTIKLHAELLAIL